MAIGYLPREDSRQLSATRSQPREDSHLGADVANMENSKVTPFDVSKPVLVFLLGVIPVKPLEGVRKHLKNVHIIDFPEHTHNSLFIDNSLNPFYIKLFEEKLSVDVQRRGSGLV